MADQESDMNDKLEENVDAVTDQSEEVEAPESIEDEEAVDVTSESDQTESDIVEEMSEVETDADESVEDDSVAPKASSLEPETPPQPIAKKDWYILKVQVNREDSIKRRLEERVKQTGLEKYIEAILVPTEKVTTVKNGKKRVTKRKLYPGYLMVNMEINDDTWFLVRETAGIGDFTGAAGKPVPMLAHEVQRILQAEKGDTEEAPKLRIPYEVGDMVKINDGTFKEIEGEVSMIDEITGRVTVIITIFARSTPVELEYWQIEKVS